MYHRIEVTPRAGHTDPRGESAARQVRDFLGLPVTDIKTREVFSLFIDCDAEQARVIANAFANPVIQRASVGVSSPDVAFDWLVVVGYRPGVTDNVARSARSAIADIVSRPLADDEAVYTSVEYFVAGPTLSRADVEHIANDLLANALIQSITVLSPEEVNDDGPPVNRPEVRETAAPAVRQINLDVTDEELLRISREGTLALTLAEMKTIQAYFSNLDGSDRKRLGLGNMPTDAELEVLAQTWSEHCKHKIFSSRIRYTDEKGHTDIIDSCFKTFIRGSTGKIAATKDWLLSVFKDNAGVIRFNDRLSLVFKVETHNSPTALDPYGGSITGIVGVNRDPLGTGMGAELLLNVWGYCFASPFTDPAAVPRGLFHPRRLRDQVHKGVIDGGNQSGIPYATGWEYFDERYLGKPLVYCGTVGVMPRTVNGAASEEKTIVPGDAVLMIGGRIGKDGIHGATFSSEELHQDSPVQAVQIGDPITQKMVSDFLLEARDRGLYRFITDNGAGGLSSSVGEMCEECGGCDIDLSRAPLKYAGLQPWEILLSEAQERMSLAVPQDKLQAFLILAEARDVEATVLGQFTDSGKFHVRYGSTTVACLDVAFMHDGLPQLELAARWTPPTHDEPDIASDLNIGNVLQTLLSRLNICSGEYKARQYDHEVKGLSVIKPYVGVHNNVQSDATVSMVEPLGLEGVVLSAGVAPRYSDIDTYHMMASIIDLALRRAIAVGGQPDYMAGLDNFCWPDPVASPANPDGEYKLAQLVRANQALHDYSVAFGVPCISGKDSMKNDSTLGGKRISIPPTVLFSVVGRLADVRKATTLDAKRYGDTVYIIGETRRELGGSEFFAWLGAVGNAVPKVEADRVARVYRKVAAATDRELVHSLHAPAFGGLGVGLAKVAVGGHLGLDIDLNSVPAESNLSDVELLFSESAGRFIATVSPDRREAFESCLDGIPFARVGTVTLDPTLILRREQADIARLSVDDLTNAYCKPLETI